MNTGLDPEGLCFWASTQTSRLPIFKATEHDNVSDIRGSRKTGQGV